MQSKLLYIMNIMSKLNLISLLGDNVRIKVGYIKLNIVFNRLSHFKHNTVLVSISKNLYFFA